jgi:hypothetical protein
MAFSPSAFIGRKRKRLFSQGASDNGIDPQIKGAIVVGGWAGALCCRAEKRKGDSSAIPHGDFQNVPPPPIGPVNRSRPNLLIESDLWIRNSKQNETIAGQMWATKFDGRS